MNIKLILIVFVIAGLSSCSTAYRIAQTPDDVYYSPTPQQNEYVQVNNEENRNVYDNRSVYDNSSPEDREILRRINNRRLRRHRYDYGYGYPSGYGYYPYGNYPVYVDPKTGGSPSPSTYKAPRKYNLGTYSKPPVTTSAIDPKTGEIKNVPNTAPATTNGTPARTFQNKGTAVGNLVRKVFSNPGTNYSTPNNDNTTRSRTFEPSRNSNSNSSSSSSSRTSSTSTSSGSSAPVRTFNK